MAIHGFTLDDHLIRNEAVWPGLPYIVSCWFNVPSFDDRQVIYFIGENPTHNDWRHSILLDNRLDQASFNMGDHTGGSTIATQAPGSYQYNTWTHGASSQVSTTFRAAYLSGNKGTADDFLGTFQPVFTKIGARATSRPFEAGAIAEISIWDTSGFSESDRDDLVNFLGIPSNGTVLNPLDINEQSEMPWEERLYAYFPLLDNSDFTDHSGNGHHLSLVGSLSTFASHPPVAESGAIQPATNVVATAINSNRVDLSWTKSENATEYVIQRLEIV